jgi:cholest-4-en-3-one 26-monooxygenase
MAIDIFDPAVYEKGVPWEAYAWLRRNAPVYRHPGGGGAAFWAVTRHADVVQVSRDPVTFSSYARSAFFYDDDEEKLARDRLVMLNQDPPRHTATRAVVNRGFTPRMVERLAGRIREICETVVEDAVRRETVDFARDIAAPLPLHMMCELLGAPAEDRAKILDWTNRVIAFDDPEFATDGPPPVVRLAAYGDAMATRRRAEPRDDIITRLVTAGDDGTALEPAEVGLFVALLAIAGTETVRNAAAGGMLAFLDHPDQWARLREDHALLRTLPDELLRWVSPVIAFRRTATRETFIGDQPVTAGDKVVVFYPSANRDESVFHDPETFDIGREPNPHLAFGGGGPHYCLGAHLARLELRVLFEVLVEHVASVTPAGPVRRLRSSFVNGVKEMPVRLARNTP